MKKIFALALTIALLSSLTVACGDAKETATVDTPAITNEQKADEESVNEENTVSSSLADENHEESVIERTVKPAYAKVMYTPDVYTTGPRNIKTIEYLGKYNYQSDGTYSLTIDDKYTYYFAANGLLTKYEYKEQGEVKEEEYFINGVGILGSSEQARHDNGFNVFFYSTGSYLDDLFNYYNYKYEYDSKGNMLGDILTIGEESYAKEYVVIERDDKGRIAETWRFKIYENDDYTPKDVIKCKEKGDFSKLNEFFEYFSSVYEYNEEENIMTINGGHFEPNYKEKKKNYHCDAIVKYNELGLPVALCESPDRYSDYSNFMWHYEYDEYGYLSHVYYISEDDHSFPSIRIENVYDDSMPKIENADDNEGTINVENTTGLASEETAFEFLKQNVNNDVAFSDHIFYDVMDMDTYYLFDFYGEDTTGSGVQPHLCYYEVEKNLSEIRFGDATTMWEPQVVYP